MNCDCAAALSVSSTFFHLAMNSLGVMGIGPAVGRA
jgi:hypothetical protein